MIGSAVRKLGDGISGGGRFSIDSDRITRWTLSAFGLVLLIAFWEAVTTVLSLNPKYFPGPMGVVTELIRIWPAIVAALPNTLSAALVGYLLALTLSIVIAIPLVASDRLLNALMPFIIGTNTVPRIAMTPLVIYWVSFYSVSMLYLANYVMAVWVAFFPMLIAAIDGFRSIDEDTENMLEVYGATTWQEFKYVRFKNGLPFIFDGMKIGFVLAMIGAVVGEFVSGTFGIGSQAASAIGRTSIARAFAIVLVLGLISTGVVLIVYLIESKMIFWRESSIMGAE
ncbi:binding-protein-dependent transporters inner membrane component [Haloarcula japonica DSM 6131]|uniref:Binding-protein-dependent transporters inner membrane component n=1 Tax=Haloarcula japonica (strain ATCC 49778 / DSM 6131 / JCM 7785 / NBRC 101032 / NCIMB 13157 / TR-1) TaxID=1227453 RepID=M0L485_HALJT|nr:ABC transporter permease [Haloarcula japonica]EMA28392.1 binding-protein-dependent transporters inner membrane component [Haloarcula japonica DSM 6131]